MNQSKKPNYSIYLLIISICVFIFVLLSRKEKAVEIVHFQDFVELHKSPPTPEEIIENREIKEITSEIKKLIPQAKPITNKIIDEQMELLAGILLGVDFNLEEQDCGNFLKKDLWTQNDTDYACLIKFARQKQLYYISQYYINADLIRYESFYKNHIEPISYSNHLIDNKELTLSFQGYDLVFIILDQDYIIKKFGVSENSLSQALTQIVLEKPAEVKPRLIVINEQILAIHELLKSQCSQLNNEHACKGIEENGLKKMHADFLQIINATN